MARLKTVGPRLAPLKGKLKAEKRVDPFYVSAAYLAWREAVFALKGRRCAVPGCETPEDRVTADHIVERKDGGAELNPANGAPLCHRHHLAKTHGDRRRRARG